MGFDENKRGLVPLLLLSQVFGLAAAVMITYNQSNSGLDWSAGPTVQFNYHPIFMVVGLIYLNGTAIMLYRAFPNATKTPVKIAHLILQLLVLVLCILGAYLAYNFKVALGSDHFTSVHGWIGLMTVGLFTVQWVLSLIIFILPGVPGSVKGAYKVLHVYFGGAIFVAAICAVMAGAGSSTLINSMAMCIVAFACIVGIVLTTDSYKRPAESAVHAESLALLHRK